MSDLEKENLSGEEKGEERLEKERDGKRSSKTVRYNEIKIERERERDDEGQRKLLKETKRVQRERDRVIDRKR